MPMTAAAKVRVYIDNPCIYMCIDLYVTFHLYIHTIFSGDSSFTQHNMMFVIFCSVFDFQIRMELLVRAAGRKTSNVFYLLSFSICRGLSMFRWNNALYIYIYARYAYEYFCCCDEVNGVIWTVWNVRNGV